ncbi:PEP-CTERM sorting domain-containing protein [Maioricimonas sp. JC845]|uniref:PEP-CTERM sorting domain-containing protein n=1 Tax=Maioricimonas sp. JC845 TaxID=3232138 RepID=UPI00345B0A3A
MRTISGLALCAVIGVVTAGQARAGMITLSATDSGSYNSTGGHNSSDENYLAWSGWFEEHNRNFFTFDLRSLSETIVGATLRLETPPSGFSGSPATFSLYDVTTPVATLTTDHSGPAGQAIFADLGTGDFYGSIGIDGGLGFGTILSISLNAQAISDLNAAIGSDFAFGGAVSNGEASVFGGAGSASLRKLVLETSSTVTTTTPEPSSLALFSIGAAMTGLGAARRRRRETQQQSEDTPQEA